LKFKNIFLTGKIQIGKSTAISKFLAKHIDQESTIAGFKTKAYYENNNLKGYYIENQKSPFKININENIVGINNDFGSGKSCYGITKTFEENGVDILDEAMKTSNSIILMDELGFFERKAEKFQSKVHETLNSDHRVIGVIKERRNEFLNSIANRSDVVVIRVTLENRDSIVDEINKYWESWLWKTWKEI